jgi:YHS domain-containing protein
MPSRRIFLGLAVFAPAVLRLSGPALAASPEVFSTNQIAISGYDPIAYFLDGRPVEGTDNHMLKWRGAIWRFASPENMHAFEMAPHAYAPQYGGYCAYAMAQGAVATTVPEAWTVHNDRLYLNFSTGVRQLWQKDIPGHVAAADSHWPAALNG